MYELPRASMLNPFACFLQPVLVADIHSVIDLQLPSARSDSSLDSGTDVQQPGGAEVIKQLQPVIEMSYMVG